MAMGSFGIWQLDEATIPDAFDYEAWQAKLNKEKQKAMANRMIGTIQTYASVLALQSVRCYLSTGGSDDSAPAWSDAGSIGFALEALPDLSTSKGALIVKGLAIHEIGHILFTARLGSELRDYVLDNDYSIAYNILEDSRLEALMIGRFGQSVATWLRGVVANYITEQSDEDLAQAYPLVAGRHYLPIELRSALRSAYFEPEHTQAFHDLASEYRTMANTTPSEVERAKEIIKEFYDLLPKQKGGSGNQPGNQTGRGGTTCGWPVKDIFSHDKRADNENPGGLTTRQANTKSKERAKAKAEKQASPEPAVNHTEATGVEKQVTHAENDKSIGAGGDQQVLDPVLVKTIQNQAADLLGESEYTLAKELSNDLADYSGKTELLATKVSDLRKATYNLEQPSPEAVAGSRAFRLQLERIKNDFMPEWVRRVPEGKIHAGRYLLSCDLDEAFDKFDEGNDEVASIEAVIILDKSGSMGNVMEKAYEAMWAVKKALDEIGASTSVITFSSGSHVLYGADETAAVEMRTFGCGGGTDPHQAIVAARNIFANTTRPVKLFMAITDGEWYSKDEEDPNADLIREMRQADVLTSLVTIDYKSQKNHNCELMASISGCNQLFSLAQELVNVAIKRNLAHI